jgi:iron(II)-dependent oxidoreductase
MKPFWMLLVAVLIASLGAWGCGDDDDDGSASDADADTDTDTDTDTDADTDADTDTDTDSDTDSDTDADADLAWVAISGGTFQMGSTEGSSNELPVHGVTVPVFEMLETEVTVAQYAVCVTASACTEPSTSYTQCNWNETGYEDHPVNCVNWQQAVDFCQWVGGRLPSESEWEYAARSGGQDIDYPWGDETASCAYAVMDDEGSDGCGTGRTWAVCSKPAGNTVQGLCDMAGNVWEWVQDFYHPDYTGAPADGSAWEDPDSNYRVTRGGDFQIGDYYLRAAFRNLNIPEVMGINLGFRCAR